MAAPRANSLGRTIQAGVLGWLLPGAGHFLLGHRGLALVFFIPISFAYWTGLALGGMLDAVNPRTNKWVCLAASGLGGYTLPSVLVSQAMDRSILARTGLPAVPSAQASPADYSRFLEARAPYMAFYPEADVAQIYLATAGLLNLLAILDAIARAQTGGLPTFHRELAAEPGLEGAP